MVEKWPHIYGLSTNPVKKKGLLSQLRILTFSDDRASAALAIVTLIANEIVQIGSKHRLQWPIAIPVPGEAMMSMFRWIVKGLDYQLVLDRQ